MIKFEDGQLIKPAYVTIDGVENEVTPAKYEGNTPLSSYNLNRMQEKILEDGIIVSPTEPTTDRRKVWFKKGKNLFNKKNITEGYYIDVDGSLKANESVFCSDFIEVNGNSYICITHRSGWNVFAMYDTNENFISRVSPDSKGIYYLPEQCRYIRINSAITDKDIIQIEHNTEATNYEEYVNPTVYVKNDNNIYEKTISKDEVDTLQQKIAELETNQFLNKQLSGAINANDYYGAKKNGVYSLPVSSASIHVNFPTNGGTLVVMFRH